MTVQLIHRVLLLLAIIEAALGASFVVLSGSDIAVVIALSGLCGAIGLLPGVRRDRKYEVFSPTNLLGVNAFAWICIQPLYLAAKPLITNRLLFGQGMGSLIPGTLAIGTGLLMFQLGYGRRAFKVQSQLFDRVAIRHWASTPAVFAATAAVAVIAVVGMMFYLRGLRLGLPDLLTVGGLSAKRRVVVSGGAVLQESVLGYRLWLAESGTSIFLLFWAWVATRIRITFVSACWAAALFALASFPFVVSSSRFGLIGLIIQAVVIRKLIRGSLKARTLLWSLLGILFAISFLGGLRSIGQGKADTLGVSSESILDNLYGYHNGMTASKVARVIEGVPTLVPYQHGKSLITWLIAPIPRTLWPDKPLIRVSSLIGKPLFNFQDIASGIPPGLMGELWLNFGVTGLIIGMWFYGYMMKGMWRSFEQSFARPFVAVVYSSFLVAFVIQLPQTDLSGAMIFLLRQVIPVSLLWLLITKRSSRSVSNQHGPAKDRLLRV